MAIQKITADVIATSAVTTDSLSDSSITAAKLHTTLDLTGKTVTVATASAGDNDTTVASTAFVSTAIANLADSAPSTLNTLNELAAALGDDASFSTTVTNSIALKAPLASPTFTGDVTFDTSTLVVDATNNRVGIGTTSPNAPFKLDVEGAVRTNGSGFYVSANYSSTNNVYKIYENSNEFRIESQIYGNANAASSPIVFATSNTDGRLARMTIDASGNVQIGTSSHVNLSGSATELTIGVSGDTDNSGGGISFAHNGSTLNGYILGQKTSLGVGSQTGYTYLVAGGSEKMRITSDGRLQFAQVAATDTNNSIFAHTNNYLYLEGGSSGIVLADNSENSNRILVRDTNKIEFQTSGATRATINAAGSTGAVLDLEPNANIDGSLYSALTINEQHSTAHSGVRFDRSGTPKYRIGIDNSDNFQIANFRTTTDDAAFVMDVDGDIGIGTASPAASLHIHRDASENTPGLRLTTGKDSGTPTAQIDYSTGSGYFLRLADAANNEDVMIRTYGDTIFHGGSVSIGDQLKVGSFTNGQTNTGEAWIGRASDRNEGTLTVQIGGGTTGRYFEVVDHDWQKVVFSVDSNADANAIAVPVAGGTGITINNTHNNAEPYNNIHVRSGSSIGGIGLYSTLQSHLRFKTGGGSGAWNNGQGHQWQLRMGNGQGQDRLQVYAWTGNKGLTEWHGSTGNIEMPYQAGARYGIPTTQTIGTTTSVVNFSDTNANFGCYQRSGISNSSGTITVSHAGIYDISMCARTEATPFRSPTQFRMMFDNSGTGSGTFVQWQRLYITSNTQSSYEHAPPFHVKVQLVAGARFQITADTGSGSFQLSTTSNTVCFLTINKIA